MNRYIKPIIFGNLVGLLIWLSNIYIWQETGTYTIFGRLRLYSLVQPLLSLPILIISSILFSFLIQWIIINGFLKPNRTTWIILIPATILVFHFFPTYKIAGSQDANYWYWGPAYFAQIELGFHTFDHSSILPDATILGVTINLLSTLIPAYFLACFTSWIWRFKGKKVII